MCSYSSALTNVFDTGNYNTELQRIESGSNTVVVVHQAQFSKALYILLLFSIPPPSPLLIATPLEAGEFPVLLFLHGYLLENSFYSQLIQHIASHGFIIIAPQFRQFNTIMVGADTSDDIKSAAAITNWLSEGLSKFLPQNVRPALSKLALAGHSRGGKTAFALALNKLNITTNLKFSAIIGVDPVDGMDKGKQTPPPVLTYARHSFEFDMPAMVIGSGLGEVQRFPFVPTCAPKGVNHMDFFNECQKPSWHFVAKDYGHCDMLDDDTKGMSGVLWGIFTYYLCKNGESRRPMRRFVGGVIVAFLKAYLLGNDNDLLAVRKRPEIAPVELEINYLV